MKRSSPRVTRGGLGSWLTLVVLVSAAFGPLARGAAPNAAPTIPLRQPGNELRVHTLDVDQGQAVLVQTLDGKNILMDAGEDYASPRLVGYLKKIGVKKIDWLVISHRHMDHIGGVPALAKAFPVENLVTPWAQGQVPRTAMVWLAPLRRDLKQGFGKDNRPKFHTATTGKRFDFGGGAKADVLWPPKSTGGVPIGDYNEESVVMRVSQKAPKNTTSASFVVGGDLGWQIERHLAQTKPDKLRADGLVGNHHGSKGSFERTYLEAIAGHSSTLLAEGGNGSQSAISKLARTVLELSRKKNGKALASQVGLLLYQGNNDQTGAVQAGEAFATQGLQHVRPGDMPKIDALARRIAASLQKDAQVGGRFPWVTYSAGNDNPYSHPNSERMALSTLLGCTMLGTDDHGYVVMTRKVGKDGDWTGGWQGHTLGNMKMPDVSGRMPAYKRRKDPKNPYDNAAREANFVFSVDHPDPTVPWKDKEQFLAPPGRTETTMFLMEARAARQGRAAFVREFRALRAGEGEGDKKADALLRKAKANPWHGATLDGQPWDQDGNEIWRSGTAQQNSRLARRMIGDGRPTWLDATLAQRFGRGLAVRRLARGGAASRCWPAQNGFAKPAAGTSVIRIQAPAARQAQRNSLLRGSAGRPAWLRSARPSMLGR